jgi:hypothetical protein
MPRIADDELTPLRQFGQHQRGESAGFVVERQHFAETQSGERRTLAPGRNPVHAAVGRGRPVQPGWEAGGSASPAWRRKTSSSMTAWRLDRGSVDDDAAGAGLDSHQAHVVRHHVVEFARDGHPTPARPNQ